MMTDDELIARAVDAVRGFERLREADDPFRALDVDAMRNRRIEGSTVVFFGETGVTIQQRAEIREAIRAVTLSPITHCHRAWDPSLLGPKTVKAIKPVKSKESGISKRARSCFRTLI